MSAVQDHLDQFYIELQAWIDGGCKERGIFDVDESICINAVEWSAAHGFNDAELYAAIGDGFEGAGLSRDYPFNGDSAERWGSEQNFYTNPARLAWIKEHAEAALARRAAGEVAA